MLFISALLLCNSVIAQIVDIPDPNFKNALVNTFCVDTDGDGQADFFADANGDGEIQVSEAEAIDNLFLSNQNISSLVGIEAFINLIDLWCGFNNLTTLDLSQNNMLEKLSCDTNQLSNINITQNLLLKYLYCGLNNLQELDVSNNSSLIELFCHGNELQSIDVSSNSALTYFKIFANQLTTIDVTQNINLVNLGLGNNNISEIDLSQNINLLSLRIYNNQITSLILTNNINLVQLSCSNNPLAGTLYLSQNNDLNLLLCTETQLTSIDIKNGNNVNMVRLEVFNNPNLTCIQVDDVIFANNQVCNLPGNNDGWCKDETASYSEDCLLGLTENELQDAVQVFPNPVQEVLTIIASNNTKINKIQVYDVLGKLVLEQKNNVNQLKLSTLAKGLLFLKIETDRGILTKKVIKE